MSQFKVEVVSVKLGEHPNADSLSIVEVEGWQIVVKTLDFVRINLGAYIPLDAIVPATSEWEFMKDSKYRVKTKKLRGALSQGLLIPAKPEWKLGQDVTEELGIRKYIPGEDSVKTGGDSISAPGNFKYHTDIERIQNFPEFFDESHDVVITEKIHGTNFRFGVIDDEFMIGSHTTRKRVDGSTIYAVVTGRLNLE